MAEFNLITRYFKPLAKGHIGSLQLCDDAALLAVPADRQLVVTKDMLAQGVHFRQADPPETLGAKLIGVNLSDLAAMGAQPLGCFLGLGLPKNWQEDWVKHFAQGLGAACARYECPLLGGDTISALENPVLSLTALGSVPNGQALLRSKAQVGDSVFVSGTIGLAGMGLRVLMGEHAAPAHTKAWVNRYQCPEPRLALGQALVGLAHSCVDVSDGVFADARHIATASQLCIEIDVHCLPVPEGVDPLVAATLGDDYELLFTLPAQKEPEIFTLSQRLGLKITRIGRCLARHALQDPFLVAVDDKGQRVTPTRLGYEHP